MADVQTSKVNEKLAPVNVEVFYADRSSEDEQLLLHFYIKKKQKYKHGVRLKLKFINLWRQLMNHYS
jgi:aspartyl-tRNA synthetase